MRSLPFPLLFFVSSALAGTAGTFDEVVSDTRVSAMMMFVGNNDKVYIVDKAQGNAAQINGHSAWGSVWDVNSGEVTLMDIKTNTFCSSGSHLPNGSFVQLGGNSAVAIGGGDSSQKQVWDDVLQDFDGSRAIRILNPCTSSQDFTSSDCQWYDDPADGPKMQAQRWYSTAEPLANGTLTIMGGFTGGDILRLVPNTDPTIGASLTYEFFPSNGVEPQNLNFLHETSGINMYPHAFLMASGKMFLQTNLSTTLWDYNSNVEEPLPKMPNGVIRTYPASGATAMLPMTPKNNYTQTIIFCGGSDMAEPLWGNFSFPFYDTWTYPASKDCQTITPEPSDGSPAKYVQDDAMFEGRTMGQFIILPDGKLLVVNGGLNGTAGYGHNTSTTATEDMPFYQSFASGPVGTPALYDPEAPSGSRWSRPGFDTSKIARLYHSSALLMVDGSVLIAGSNPNLDVNISSTTLFPTTYVAEKFYPPYFNATTRPAPSGVPSTLSYGGKPFDITVPASSYSGSSNTAAANTVVNVIRPGWTTHGMNMGQRFLTLNNTYTVNQDGSIVLHVAQMPPNPNIFQPGPAFVWVVVNGIPSNGTYVIIGSGNIETQPVADVSVLPVSVLQDDASGSAGASNTGAGSPDTGDTDTGSSHKSWLSSHVGLIAGVAGGAAAVALFALAVGICLARRRRARIGAGIAAGKVAQARTVSMSPYQQNQGAGSFNDSHVFLNKEDEALGSHVWDANASSPGFEAYRDDAATPVSMDPATHYQQHHDSAGGARSDHDSYYDHPSYQHRL